MNGESSGIKSGLIAGFVYGILDSVFSILLVIENKANVLAAIDNYISHNPSLFQHVTAVDLYSLGISLIPMIAIIGGLLLGLVFGAIFGYIYNWIPGNLPSVKGIVFGILLWLILNVLLGLFTIQEFGVYFYVAGIAGGLFAALAYGYTLGVLYWSLVRRKSGSGTGK